MTRTRKPAGRDVPAASGKAPEVTALLDALGHPLRADFERVRAIVLGASPEVREGVKWNSASYRTKEWFATIQWRSRDAVQLVFHRGAKVKDNSTAVVKLDDPQGLVRWLAKDRCLVTLGAGKDVDARRAAFEAIVREWVRQM